MSIRERVCFELSRRLIGPPPPQTSNYEAYAQWREDELVGQWKYFSEEDIRGKHVVDFGCGFGNLAMYLARFEPKQITGVELAAVHVAKAEELRRASTWPNMDRVRFLQGTRSGMPIEDRSIDTLLAFDCVEHVMEPEAIFEEWHRVLRPGGKVLIWWSPFRSPYGPHMEAVVPIPWAHVIFGERAVMRTAARIYDLDEFVPRPWHFEEDGTRKPNVWRQWSTFREQAYINEMTEKEFVKIAKDAQLDITRLEPHSFAGTPLRRIVGSTLLKVPVLSEYVTSFYIVELTRPAR